MHKKTLRELANLIGGEVRGDAHLAISGISSIEKAREGEITFIAQSKYLPKVRETKASAIITTDTIEGITKPFILTDNPYLAYAKLATLFHPHPEPKPGIAESAMLGEGTRIGRALRQGQRLRPVQGSGKLFIGSVGTGHVCDGLSR